MVILVPACVDKCVFVIMANGLFRDDAKFTKKHQSSRLNSGFKRQ